MLFQFYLFYFISSICHALVSFKYFKSHGNLSPLQVVFNFSTAVTNHGSLWLQVLENFIPPLLEAVLTDYNQTQVPAAREPEVLVALTKIVDRLQSNITSLIPRIFESVFECTLDMINKDLEEFPEHRINFFLLLQVCLLFSLESYFFRDSASELSATCAYDLHL